MVDNAGNRPLPACRRALTRTGVLVPNANTHGRWLGGPGRTIKALVMAPFVPQRIRPFAASVNQADLLALTELTGSGKVTPVIDRTYPLSQAPDAIGYLENRHARERPSSRSEPGGGGLNMPAHRPTAPVVGALYIVRRLQAT